MALSNAQEPRKCRGFAFTKELIDPLRDFRRCWLQMFGIVVFVWFFSLSNIAPGIGPMISHWVSGHRTTAASKAVTHRPWSSTAFPFRGATGFDGKATRTHSPGTSHGQVVTGRGLLSSLRERPFLVSLVQNMDHTPLGCHNGPGFQSPGLWARRTLTVHE